MLKNKKGITLIALIITIIILIILAGITISTLAQNGLFGRTQDAKEKTNIAREKEQIKMSVMAVLAKDYTKIAIGDLEEELGKYEDISSVNGVNTIPNNVEIVANKKVKLRDLFISTSYAADATDATDYEYAEVTYNSGRIYYVKLKGNDIGKIYKTPDGVNPPKEDGKDPDKNPGERLSLKVKTGDYVTYTPDTASTDSILEDFETYSGSTTYSLTQENDLKWRVLDIVDGKVRLISEMPSTNRVSFAGYNGYNNAVYLLDKTCEKLYNKSGYAEKVQNLKIEDIVKYMVTKPTADNTIETEGDKYYPNILIQEKDQTIVSNGITQPTTRLDISEQTIPIIQTTGNTAESLNLKNTTWYQSVPNQDYFEEEYYNLFIGNGSNSSTIWATYWISSRCISASDTTRSQYQIRYVDNNYGGKIAAMTLYDSNDNNSGSNTSRAIRPVVTLNADVLVTAGSGTKEIPYEISL